MKVSDIMTRQVIPVGQEETVAAAARTLTHYNIGILPVCDSRGRVQGLVTDRDLVTRCLAAGKKPEQTRVWEVMTRQVTGIEARATAREAAQLMAKHQIRRLPVVDGGQLCGMVSLGDIACAAGFEPPAAAALKAISGNVRADE